MRGDTGNGGDIAAGLMANYVAEHGFRPSAADWIRGACRRLEGEGCPGPRAAGIVAVFVEAERARRESSDGLPPTAEEVRTEIRRLLRRAAADWRSDDPAGDMAKVIGGTRAPMKRKPWPPAAIAWMRRLRDRLGRWPEPGTTGDAGWIDLAGPADQPPAPGPERKSE
jgi:hypothetical protein